MTATIAMLVLLLAPRIEVRDPAAYRLVAAVTIAVVTRDASEARDLYRLAHAESRWTPKARSPAGACGVWQQIPRFKATTCAALQAQPVHAALVAVQTTRTMRRLCGDGWWRCYQRGPGHPSNRPYRSANRRGW